MAIEWKPTAVAGDFYSVSSDGQVARTRTQYGKPKWSLCRPTDRRGYAGFALCVENKVRWMAGHRLVWEAFKGAIPEGLQINHLNGIKSENRLLNLELSTGSENTRHAKWELGKGIGSTNGSSVLTEADIPQIRELYAAGLSQQRIADCFGVKQITISRVVRRETWPQVP